MNKNIDIKNLKTAKRYALALIKSENIDLDKICADLSLINEVIFENKDFTTFFLHPVVSLKDKKTILKETLVGKIEETTLNFLELLLDENRFNIFKTIFEVFKDEVNKIQNRKNIEIISAVNLDDEQKEKLKKKLDEKLNKDVILNYTKDENIVAGLVIKLDDKVVDLSLKSKLKSLRQN